MNTGRSEKQAEAEQAVVLRVSPEQVVVLRVSRARPASEESVAHLWVPGALALSAHPRAAPEAGAPSDLPGGGCGRASLLVVSCREGPSPRTSPGGLALHGASRRFSSHRCCGQVFSLSLFLMAEHLRAFDVMMCVVTR